MRALCWHGKEDMRVDEVPDPKIVHGRDAIIKVTLGEEIATDKKLSDLALQEVNRKAA